MYTTKYIPPLLEEENFPFRRIICWWCTEKKIFGFDLFLRQRLLTKKINLLLLKYYACIVLDRYSIDDSSLKTIIIIHRYVQFLDDKKVFQFLGRYKVWGFYPDDEKITVRGCVNWNMYLRCCNMLEFC